MNSTPITYIEKLAEGGVSHIFLAKTLAVTGEEKYLICKCAKPLCKSEFIASIEREIYFAEKIRHPNILDIFERRCVQEEDCLVMEYMDGGNFQKLLQICSKSSQHIPYELAIYAVGQAALGLHAAHEITDEFGTCLDTVHRDISPENILFSMDGEIKISDFGIAVTNQIDEPDDTIYGKFNYMSPEQAWGDSLDRRSDIFSLAAVLYEAVTGCRFNPDDDPNHAVKNAQFGLFAPPHDLIKDFPVDLEQILLKSLDLDRELRFNTALDFKEAIDSCASKHHWCADRHDWLNYLQKQSEISVRQFPRMKRADYVYSTIKPDLNSHSNCQIQNQHSDSSFSKTNLKTSQITSSSQFAVQREKMNPEDIDRTEALEAPSLEMLKALENEMQNKGSVLDDVFNTIDAEHCLEAMRKEKSNNSALDDIFNSIDAEKAAEAKIQSQSKPITPNKESSFNERAKIRRMSSPRVFRPSMVSAAIPAPSSNSNHISTKAQDSASIALEEFLRMEQESSTKTRSFIQSNQSESIIHNKSSQIQVNNVLPQDSASIALEEFLKLEREDNEKTKDSAPIASNEVLHSEQESIEKTKDSASAVFDEFLKMEQKNNEMPQDSASIALAEFLRMEQESSEKPQDTASAALEEFLRMEQESSEKPQDTASAALEEFLRMEETNKPISQDTASAALEEFLKEEKSDNNSIPNSNSSSQSSQLQAQQPQLNDNPYAHDFNKPFAELDSNKTDILASPYDANGNLILDDLFLPPNDFEDDEDDLGSATTVLRLDNNLADSNSAVQDEPTNAQPAFMADEPTNAQPAFMADEPTNAQPAFMADEPTNAQPAFMADEPTNAQSAFMADEPTFNANDPKNAQSANQWTNSQQIFHDNFLSPQLSSQNELSPQLSSQNELNPQLSSQNELSPQNEIFTNSNESNNSNLPFGYDPCIENLPTVSGTYLEIEKRKLKEPTSKLSLATIILIALAIIAASVAAVLIYIFYI